VARAHGGQGRGGDELRQRRVDVEDLYGRVLVDAQPCHRPCDVVRRAGEGLGRRGAQQHLAAEAAVVDGQDGVRGRGGRGDRGARPRERGGRGIEERSEERRVGAGGGGGGGARP